MSKAVTQFGGLTKCTHKAMVLGSNPAPFVIKTLSVWKMTQLPSSAALALQNPYKTRSQFSGVCFGANYVHYRLLERRIYTTDYSKDRKLILHYSKHVERQFSFSHDTKN